MSRIPDITERPWWTAAQPERDPNYPYEDEEGNLGEKVDTEMPQLRQKLHSRLEQR